MNCNQIKILLLIILVLVLHIVFAEQSWNGEGTTLPDDLIEDLIELKDNPLDINSASSTDLSILPWLNDLQIDRIIKFRKKKLISSKKQLIALGIDEISLEEMSDYITLQPKKEIHITNCVRLELPRSKLNDRSCTKTFSKTTISQGNWGAGFISQKDEGERDLLDFYSYYLTLKNTSFLRNAILGKFRIYSGLGILLASKLGGSKTTTTAGSQIKNKTVIKPYTGSFESWEMEGFCSELQFGKFCFFPFFSSSPLSANLDDGKISSFNESGIHLDPEKKNNVKEIISGLISEYSRSTFSLTLSGYHLAFNRDFADPAINQKSTALGINCEFFRRSSPLIIEICWAESRISWLGSLSLMSDNFRQQLILRSYPGGFPSWHGNPISSRSSFQNEIGFYYGFTYSPVSSFKLNFYIDLWTFPETRYFEKMPTAGNEIMVHSSFKLQDNSLLRLHFKQRNQEKYISLDAPLIRDLQNNKFRLDWLQTFGHIKFQSRLEAVSEYLQEEEIFHQGYLLSQLVKVKTDQFTCTAQIACFRSSILMYLYEYSVDGVMSNIILSGNDTLFNISSGILLFKYLKIQASVSGTIKDNNKMKFRFQLITKF